jgi:anthranilate phosphoribosyltransferase
VYGHDGLDELTTTTLSSVVELCEDGELRRYELDPGAHGITKAEPAALRGGDSATNAAVARTVLAGEPGAARDIVVLNGAGALVAAGLSPDLSEGLSLAAKAIDTGAASEALDRLITASNDAALSG